MASEKSSLLSSSMARERRRRTRPLHETRVAMHGSEGTRQGNTSGRDEDLLNLGDDNLPSSQEIQIVPSVPTTKSIKKLQARMQVRKQVQMQANVDIDMDSNSQILYDDDDDSDFHDCSNHDLLLDLNANDNIVNKEMYDARESTARIPPLVDLTVGNGHGHGHRETLTKQHIMNQHHKSETSNAFNNLIPKDKLDRKLPSRAFEQTRDSTRVPQSVQKSYTNTNVPLSPPRPLHQPVRHAKRAVSTLFGASVVVNGKEGTLRVEEKKDNDPRQTSLLDAIANSPTQSGLYHDNKHVQQKGMVLEMEEMSVSAHHSENDLPEVDFMSFEDYSPSGFLPNEVVGARTCSLNSMNRMDSGGDTAPIQRTQGQKKEVDVGDPFAYLYHARSTSTMNHRNTSAGIDRASGNKNGNSSRNVHGNSSVAKSWFGNSLNYTTSAMHMKNSENKGNDPDELIDQQLLDRLYHQGAQDTQSSSQDLRSHLNWLNVALFISYGFTSAASAVPITLIPTIAMDILGYGRDEDDRASLEADASIFASTVATYAVLGTACGKFINGPLVDIFGARRIACFYALQLAMSLTMLSCVRSSWGVIACCATVEYYQSVQWPCITVILASHYGNSFTDKEGQAAKVSPSNSSEQISHVRNRHGDVAGRYEKGIYIASLGCRCGTLIASISTTILLRYQQDSWRFVTRLAAMGSFAGCAILFLFVTDSKGKRNDPQNPIKQSLQGHDIFRSSDIIEKFRLYAKFSMNVFVRNVVPSLRSVLSNGTFWVVAIAHSGGLMVCSSVRILGTYFRDTSYGAISENEAGAVTIFLSIGVLVGLAFGGNAFANLASNAKKRKKMVASLYFMTVAMCYALAFLAIPFVRNSLNSPSLVAMFQAAASFCMGAGVAVQVYCIPAIVGCTFGANKGLYTSYTDGVACIVSSMVWRIVGNAVQEGNPQGSGWAYGWAAVALLVVLAGLLMVEFVEYYFCRGGWLGRLRDSNLSEEVANSDPTGGADLNASFVKSSKRLWQNRPAIFRHATPFKRGLEIESILSMADDDTDDDVSTIEFEDVTLPIDYADIENNQLSQNPQDTRQQVLDLLEVKGNHICVDCGTPYPRWISIIVPNRLGLNHRNASTPLSHEVACFCCTQCSGSHRKLGNHIVFVRSVDYDTFKSSEILALRRGGNSKVNGIYEALLQDISAKPSPSATLATRERFVTAKYKQKLWYDSSNNIPLHVESSLDHDTTMISIELVPKTKPYDFDPTAQFDRRAHDQYEAFVRHTDSDSDYSAHRASQKDDGSHSTEDSGEWHISSNTELKGLDNLINL